jgi:hypothetical protein
VEPEVPDHPSPEDEEDRRNYEGQV